MPAKPFSKGRPSIYLDQSHLCSAFRSTRGVDARYDGYEPLVPWIEKVANKANLCISWPHMLEFANWSEADAMPVAQWLESIPLVWMHFTSHVLQREIESAVRDVTGLPSAAPDPFANSFLATLGPMTTQSLLEGLARASVPHIVADLRRDGASKRWPETSIFWATKGHQDRQQWSANRALAQVLLSNKEAAYIDQEVTALQGRLSRLHPNAESLQNQRDLVSQVMVRLRQDRRHFRAHRIAGQLHSAFLDQAALRELDSAGFQKLGSSALDIEHAAVSAAYCDVFTCDRLTSTWLKDARAQLGLSLQVAEGEYASRRAFVEALIATFP